MDILFQEYVGLYVRRRSIRAQLWESEKSGTSIKMKKSIDKTLKDIDSGKKDREFVLAAEVPNAATRDCWFSLEGIKKEMESLEDLMIGDDEITVLKEEDILAAADLTRMGVWYGNTLRLGVSDASTVQKIVAAFSSAFPQGDATNCLGRVSLVHIGQENARSYNNESFLEPKRNINLVVLGHVDSGKSTTVGHLIYSDGDVGMDLLFLLEKLAAEKNCRSPKYAWVLDKLKAERERGITIGTSLWKFQTSNYHCTVIDTPGHCNFIKNMITGTSQADCAILILDSASGSFEAGFSQGGETLQQIVLAFAVGVKHLICCCNKMDATVPRYSKSRYEEIVKVASSHLEKVGYDPGKIPFVPISAFEGDNVVRQSTNLDWYTGPTLVGAIDMVKEPKRLTGKPLRLPLRDVDKIGGAGLLAVGRVETGVLRPNTDVTFGPTGLTTVVKTVMKHHDDDGGGGSHRGKSPLPEALPGDSVDFKVHGVRARDLKRGYVASNSHRDPAKEATSFTAMLVIVNRRHPLQITNGYTPVIDCHTARTAVQFAELMTKIDRRSGKVLEEQPRSLKYGDAAIVKMVPTEPMVVEPFSDYPPLGRFAVRDMGQTVAVGVVKSVQKKDPADDLVTVAARKVNRKKKK